MAHWLRALITLVEDASLTSVIPMSSHNYLPSTPVPVFGNRTASKKKKQLEMSEESLVFCWQFGVIVLFSVLLMFETHILI